MTGSTTQRHNPEGAVRSPLVVGLGGTARADSSTERVLKLVLAAAERRGAQTLLFSGHDLDLPMYNPQDSSRDPRAVRLVQALRTCDAVVVGSPGYHGGISGMVKNALDYVEDLRTDERTYLDKRAFGCVSCAFGWQAAVATLGQLRTIGHALRAWPTPLGLAINSAELLWDDEGGLADPGLTAQIDTLAVQLLGLNREEGDRSGEPADAPAIVADQVRLAIQTGHYSPGQSIPDAGVLAEQLGVSAATVRQAFSMLEGQGLVGPGDQGAGSHQVLDGSAGNTDARDQLQERRELVDTVIDFRIAVEGAAARLAAERRSDAQLVELRRMLAEMSAILDEGTQGHAAVARWRAADTAFHTAIADASRNSLLKAAVVQGRGEMVHLPIGAVFTTVTAHMNQLHDTLVQAIADRDGGFAERCMVEHIEGTRTAVDEYIETGRLLQAPPERQ